MDIGFTLLGLFIASYIPSYTRTYMPPPADDILGYYYYDNDSLLRVKKNTNIFDNSRKRRNSFPMAYGHTKTSLYASSLQSNTIVYEYSIVCLSVYLCMSGDSVIYHNKALVTEVQLEHLSVISSVNVFKFVYIGIPEDSLTESMKKDIILEKAKTNK